MELPKSFLIIKFSVARLFMKIPRKNKRDYALFEVPALAVPNQCEIRKNASNENCPSSDFPQLFLWQNFPYLASLRRYLMKTRLVAGKFEENNCISQTLRGTEKCFEWKLFVTKFPTVFLTTKFALFDLVEEISEKNYDELSLADVHTSAIPKFCELQKRLSNENCPL